MRFFRAYTTFNRDFAGVVAALAGAFLVSSTLSRDSTDPDPDCGDRSYTIALDVFLAAVDEFYDVEGKLKIAHRQLAQSLLKAVDNFYRPQHLSPGKQAGKLGEEYISKIRHGYRWNQVYDEGDLFFALGFHVASELLADLEFRTIDTVLATTHPALARLIHE